MIADFKRGKLAQILYNNVSKKETTTRTVIPTFVPRQNVKTIDVTELSEGDRIKMQALFEEYARYYDDFVANAFNFETWVEHTTGENITPKWRAFKVANVLDIRAEE